MKIYPHYSDEGFVNSYLIGNEASKEALIIDPGKITGDLRRLEPVGRRQANNHSPEV